MEAENTTTDVPKRTHWATASFVLSLAGWVCAALIYCDMFYELLYDSTPLFLCAPLCWAFALVFGIVALVAIRRKRPLYTGIVEAITGICASAIPLILIAAISILFYLALRGEPYQESDPASIIALIEDNSNINFPEKMQSLKAADRIAGPPDPPYVCLLVSFTTDQKGFTRLRDSLSKLDSYTEITDDYNADEYNHVYFSSYKDIPQWFKIDIAKDIIYHSFGKTKNNAITLYTTCVRSEDPDKIVVYMEGLGRPRLRKELNSR